MKPIKTQKYRTQKCGFCVHVSVLYQHAVYRRSLLALVFNINNVWSL